MEEKITNDQGHIIEACKNGDTSYVWSQIKYIGVQEEPNPETRYLIFRRAFHDFNPNINNNFIYFYKRYLKFLKDVPVSFTDYRNQKKIRDELDSPSGKVTKFIEFLKDVQW